MRRDSPPPPGLSALTRGAIAQQQVRTGVSLRIAKDEQIIDVAGLDYNGNDGKIVRINSTSDGLELTPSSTIFEEGGLTIVRTAGEALGGHRAAYVAGDGLIYHANPNSTARFTIGVTTGAAALGADVTIQCEGVIIEPSWSWSGSEVVWLAANGVLTQVVPTTGTALQVGIPAGPTALRIEPELIAILS